MKGFPPLGMVLIYIYRIIHRAQALLLLPDLKLYFSTKCKLLRVSCVVCHSLAASGDLEGLEIWSLAGADLNKPGYNGQTAVEVVRSKEFGGALSSHKTKTRK